MRKLLYPFSLIYGLVVSFRNGLFRIGMLPEKRFELPIIGIGNLRVGGTGKTPMTEYLIALLSGTRSLGVVSRGYGRKTNGYVVADSESTALEIGDEPSQIIQKFPQIRLAVDEKRVHGIEQLRLEENPPNTILLDDVYQHRYVKPGLLILLTAHDHLYIDDSVLPVGMLREPKWGANRADIIVVTKCPVSLSAFEKRAISDHLRPMSHQQVLFSFQSYGQPYPILMRQKWKAQGRTKMLLVTGIVNAQSMKQHLEKSFELIHHFEFPDHHWFTDANIESIAAVFEKENSEKTIIVTTEKDAQRLKPFVENETFAHLPIFALPMKVQFFKDDEGHVNQTIHEYIRSHQ
ncbi:MAG: tetraacyldisaccharide 4'-kinase [Flavobacteriales bacterium]|nr:tetraacyldisaccharide 4'-kinase [Flavobacteriales bacterium]